MHVLIYRGFFGQTPWVSSQLPKNLGWVGDDTEALPPIDHNAPQRIALIALVLGPVHEV